MVYVHVAAEEPVGGSMCCGFVAALFCGLLGGLGICCQNTDKQKSAFCKGWGLGLVLFIILFVILYFTVFSVQSPVTSAGSQGSRY